MDYEYWMPLLSLFGPMVYFIPWIIAIYRDHPQIKSIFVIDLFLGWTFLGWVIALAWSVGKIPIRRSFSNQN